MERIIGREKEQQILRDCVNSSRPEFLVVYGRRRIGKTYLIKNYFDGKFSFYATGVFGKRNRQQLQAFNVALHEFGDSDKSSPKNWFEAFARMKQILSKDTVRRDPVSKKRVVFLDEVPWMNSPNSDFKAALDLFWNGWASTQNDILLIVCGSATSWILKNILYDRGGIAHRITKKIHLGPMNLKECEAYLKFKQIDIPRHQTVEYYMFFVGVPYYYSLLDRRMSLAQNVNELLFSKDGALHNEFVFLFRSLFKNYERHIQVIRALNESESGLTREELDNIMPDITGGTLDRILKELIECDFIRKYNCFAKKTRGAIYQIIDPMLLFYLKYVERESRTGWLSFVGSNEYNSWCGDAFEVVCLLHVDQIKQVLGISGIETEEYSWRSRKKKGGAQIDLLIDRKDKTITICETKYHSKKFELSSKYSEDLANKRQVFIEETKTRKAVNIVMITSYGLTDSSNRHMITNEITEDQLFV
ncbi:MAG: AAA family ATPase [Lachnospiraceae bacterium]|nr:AAA family ATPase [Lachnospiraceae bacterium]